MVAPAGTEYTAQFAPAARPGTKQNNSATRTTSVNARSIIITSCCSTLVQVDQQDLRGLVDSERDRWFIGDPDPVASSQDEVVQERLAVDDMEPGAMSRLEFMDEVMPGLENGGVHQRVLVNS